MRSTRVEVRLGRLPVALDPLRVVLLAQDGVATTAQLEAWGVDRRTTARRVRAADWQRIHPGVVALHSGALSWVQRARAALLYAGPGAALSHATAGYLHKVLAEPGPTITVSIPAARRVTPQPGLVVRRRREPPASGGRLRTVDLVATVLDLVAEATSEDAVVGLLTDAVRAGARPASVLAAVSTRARVRHRALVGDLVGEVDAGVESPLELRYARDVERRHGLPPARAQVRDQVDGWWIRADRRYREGVRVELDGALAHPYGRTDDDTWRDNAVLVTRGDVTLRYRWRHVVLDPCAVARQVATALRGRGWPGDATRCGPACAAA
jgi:hypothetical protein